MSPLIQGKMCHKYMTPKKCLRTRFIYILKQYTDINRNTPEYREKPHAQNVKGFISGSPKY